METLLAYWKEITGTLLGAIGGFLIFLWRFKEIINWLVSVKEKLFPPKKSTDVVQNGFVKASFCELKHKELTERLIGQDQREQSNYLRFVNDFSNLKNSVELSLASQSDVNQRTLEHQIKISENLGKIKGKLGIE